MNEMNTNIEIQSYRLKNRELSLAEFEQWVYSEKRLEELLGPNDYLDLISLKYDTPSALYEAEKILFKIVDIGKYYEWKLRSVLEKIVDREEDSDRFIRECYDLYCDGYDFLDNVGLGFGLSLEVPPEDYSENEWDKLQASEKNRLVDSCYPEVAREAGRVIEWLDSHKIEITGHDGSYQGIEYIDRRSDKERKPTSYTVSYPKKKWWKLW